MEKEQKQKKIVYVDMDNVLVDFPHGIECLSQGDKIKYEGNYDECPDIFSLMRPLPDALESYRILAQPTLTSTRLCSPVVRFGDRFNFNPCPSRRRSSYSARGWRASSARCAGVVSTFRKRMGSLPSIKQADFGFAKVHWKGLVIYTFV